MAQQIPCDLCETEPAVTMQTNIAEGQVIGVGAGCLALFYAGALSGVTNVPAAIIQGVVDSLAKIDPAELTEAHVKGLTKFLTDPSRWPAKPRGAARQRATDAGQDGDSEAGQAAGVAAAGDGGEQ